MVADSAHLPFFLRLAMLAPGLHSRSSSRALANCSARRREGNELARRQNESTTEKKDEEGTKIRKNKLEEASFAQKMGSSG